ncbi:hypothetical protein MLD38_023044 [Melastoma candidum]|uniref:Uncharacterized protein n=1 Tax=Melastoma candidum TaxID=119954 RepID=A0ACB9QKJ9_9MYRT|nr:hypothetical protein MLD38_023044 [Melastoma candidum]
MTNKDKKKAMETINDLVEEAKLRTVLWSLLIFSVTYFLSHTSKSMWMNLPIAILLVSALRILFTEVDFCWKRSVPGARGSHYLSLLEDKQLSPGDPRLAAEPPQPSPYSRWKRAIDSAIVEAAIADFVDKILKDFVVDLWYGDITQDKEFPQQIRSVILEALGEISLRVKEINLVDLLTRDIVDLIGDHLDVFRRIQGIIGTDVMGTLSSEERDERIKFHLMASNELHPALVSTENEYKVLQRLVAGILTLVLRPQEANCPVIRSIARELVTSLVLQPVMDFASPLYVNEVIELILLAMKDDSSTPFDNSDPSFNTSSSSKNHPLSKAFSLDFQDTSAMMAKTDPLKKTGSAPSNVFEQPDQPRAADWARGLEAATQRRTEILAPENLENMWSRGRNYKKKEAKKLKKVVQDPLFQGLSQSITAEGHKVESLMTRSAYTTRPPGGSLVSPKPTLGSSSTQGHVKDSLGNNKMIPQGDYNEDTMNSLVETLPRQNRGGLKRSNSASALSVQPETKKASMGDAEGAVISEFYSADFGSRGGDYGVNSASPVCKSDGSHFIKLKCRVMGAYFEKLGSKSFAVYLIAVTDTESKTWFVKRRYSNFERLHRHLKEIPNYTLHLPPKRIFSSSTEDAFVHQRCIQLDKYLQDLLSIANVAEQHEVWDFLSASSKSYAFGKSASVMRTLAVNVDDAVDDIVRQFKGVSNGIMRKVVGSTPSPSEASSSISRRQLSWKTDEMHGAIFQQNTVEPSTSISDNEEVQDLHGQDESYSAHEKGWHSDTELNSRGFPPRVVRWNKTRDVASQKKHDFLKDSDHAYPSVDALTNMQSSSSQWGDPIGMPPEWTPPNVCVPMLNLVDKVFQLNRRGWLRRQVFWMSKQILQLVMEDAIDDWLLRQIQWLRNEETISHGIRWVQDILWPGGVFFLRVGIVPNLSSDVESSEKLFQTTSQFSSSRAARQSSFEMQLEAARRASDVKKLLLGGAPAPLVSLIGPKQYRRCARDIYYFLQSSICVKQLGYGILEILLLSVFPELRDLVVDVRQKMQPQQRH